MRKGEEMADRFQFILDQVPQWWKDLTNVRIEISMPIAFIPGAEPALPGDWIIREDDGRIRTEASEEGRVKARAYLTALRKEVGL